MGLPNYPRPAFGPSGLGLRFGLAQRGPGYCIGRATSLDLASGPTSQFFKPYQLPPSPCVQNAWAKAVTLLVSVATSTCLFGAGLVRALLLSYVL